MLSCNILNKMCRIRSKKGNGGVNLIIGKRVKRVRPLSCVEWRSAIFYFVIAFLW